MNAAGTSLRGCEAAVQVSHPSLPVWRCSCAGAHGEAAHDDATVSFFLSQTLLAEQEAKEVEELEAKLAGKEQLLMTHVEQLRGRPDLQDELSRHEMGHRLVHGEEEEKEKASDIFLLQLVGVCVLSEEFAASGFAWASFSAQLGASVNSYAGAHGHFFCEPLVTGSHCAGVPASVLGGI